MQCRKMAIKNICVWLYMNISSCFCCKLFAVWLRMRQRTRCHCRTWRRCLDRLYYVRPWKARRYRPWRSCSQLEHVTPWCRHLYWWHSWTSARREHSSELPDVLFILFIYLWYCRVASCMWLTANLSNQQSTFDWLLLSTCSIHAV